MLKVLGHWLLGMAWLTPMLLAFLGFRDGQRRKREYPELARPQTRSEEDEALRLW